MTHEPELDQDTTQDDPDDEGAIIVEEHLLVRDPDSGAIKHNGRG